MLERCRAGSCINERRRKIIMNARAERMNWAAVELN